MKKLWPQKMSQLRLQPIQMVLVLMLLAVVPCYTVTFAADGVQADTAESDLSDQSDIAANMLSDMDLTQVQEMLDEMLGENSFSFRDTLVKLKNGEEIFSKEVVQEMLSNMLSGELKREKSFFMKVLLLILLAAILTDFAVAFDSGQTGDLCFYIVYLILFILLMDSFVTAGRNLQKTVSWMTEFMRGIAPAYFMTVSVASGSASAAVFYEGVLILAWLVQCVILNVLLPGAEIFVLLAMVNHLSKEEMLGKMAELLNTVVSWGMKTLLGAVVGLQVVRNLVAPVMDTLKRSLAGKAAGALPGVGNAVNMVTELVLTSAVLIRNCLGVVVLLAFVAVGAGPVLHYGFLSLAYRFLAAIAQPVLDRRIVDSMTTMGEGYALFLKVLFTAEILCILDFLILMSGLGGGR